MKWLYKMNYKYGKYAIRNLMLYISLGQLFVYILDAFRIYEVIGLNSSIQQLFALHMPYVAQGQVWRLITFIFVPPSTNAIFIIFALYFYYMIGGALENAWSSFMLNVYYLIGMLSCIVGALLIGYGSNTYLNLSLFFAFAMLYPDFQVLLFFVLPIKIKYLALINAVVFLISLIMGPGYVRVMVLVSLVNLAIFFWKDGFNRIRNFFKTWKTRQRYREQSREWNRNNNNRNNPYR